MSAGKRVPKMIWWIFLWLLAVGVVGIALIQNVDNSETALIIWVIFIAISGIWLLARGVDLYEDDRQKRKYKIKKEVEDEFEARVKEAVEKEMAQRN